MHLKDDSRLRKELQVNGRKFVYWDLKELQALGFGDASKIPFSIRVLLESAVRNCDDYQVTREDVRRLAGWNPADAGKHEIAFKPARVVLQDFTGVPVLVDLAAMRSAMKRFGGDLSKINPQVPCDLVIDHSIQVDAFGTPGALAENTRLEFERNLERYEFLKWGQKNLRNFRAVPPATGIVHQVNLEYLASGVASAQIDSVWAAYPDSLVGTDSHTTMINGVGIVGWGVGGIEAEAVMLGEPIYMLMPEVIGVRVTGKLREGVTATDLVLRVTEVLRKKGVVGKFVEFFGAGLAALSVPDRATIANMAPEYGATMGFFPADAKTVAFYRQTGRPADQVDLVNAYLAAQGLLYEPGKTVDPVYSDVVDFDLGAVEAAIAGPKRPQDRIPLSEVKGAFKKSLQKSVAERGFALADAAMGRKIDVEGHPGIQLTHGSVVIAAITSCTNTSNPSVLIGAGLLARNAAKLGLKSKSFVKTSLAPGSLVVTEYLRRSGLMEPLEKLGFYLVGYGCTTCIGNSGPLPDEVAKAVTAGDLVAASVLSGNRNFEGRVNPHVKANFLASPLLVVAYAIAGTVEIDFEKEPLGRDAAGREVFLKDIWPSNREIEETVARFVTADAFSANYSNVFEGSPDWRAIGAPISDLYAWNPKSTYIQEPPFFENMAPDPSPVRPIRGARALAVLGDSVTTDHISPAGSIHADSPAGKYLVELGVTKADFNSYGARRGNDRVMTRGTFANIRLRNLLAEGLEGWRTIHLPSGDKMSIFEASLKYRSENTPLMILAGKEYGTGSSRDWAAKGAALLGIRAVIAESFERIHRSNLVGMGVLPLEFVDGQNRESLGLTGHEVFEIEGLDDSIRPGQKLRVSVKGPSGTKSFETKLRIDTPVEVDYYKNGGILPTVLRKLLRQGREASQKKAASARVA